jgi:anaerobic magnesium-protoporphyrin IX monomethyl ester cyclase
MMTDILFTHSYFMRFDPKQWKTMQPYPPLGTLYAASLMREEGYKVALFDTMFSESPEEIGKVLVEKNPKFVVIYDDCFNYLTKMCLTNMRMAAFDMISLAKSAGCKTIVCSSDSSDHYDLYLRNGADAVMIGEGEITLKQLIAVMSSEQPVDYSSITGIAYLSEGKIMVTGKRAVLNDLDVLPSPAWDLVNMEAYRKRWIHKHGYFSLNTVTTRGCPYKCNWCAKPVYGNRYNSHSPSRIVNELAVLMGKYHPDHIWFCDDIFGLKPEWVNEFADLVTERGLKFQFKIQSRADLLSKEGTVKALSRAGCETVWLGAESGSQKILDAMDKGIKVEEIKEARSLLKQHDIKAAFFLQFGYLGETGEDIRATIDLVKKLMPEEIGVSVSYPLPGTKFYDKVKDELKSKQNWSDSDELAMMFRPHYPKDYYKILQRYLHKEFQKHKGYENIRMLSKPAKLSGYQWRRIAALAYYLPASLWYKKRFDNYGL